MDTSKVSKAIAGALVGFIISFLASTGLIVPTEIGDALANFVTLALSAVIGYLIVYFSPANRT